MSSVPKKPALQSISLAFGLLLALSVANFAYASHIPTEAQSTANHESGLVFPKMDAEKGKKLFVDKGCVACHAVNGIGGHDAPAMDAHRKMNGVNPFDFAARMWNHAPGMIAAQEEAFEEQVNLTGDDLAHIVAFVHDDNAQHAFNENDLTAKARKMMNHSHGEMAAPKAHAEEDEGNINQ